MQASRPAIVVHDGAGAIIGWDEQAALLFGYSAREAIGNPLSLIVGDNLSADDACAVRVRVCRAKDSRLLRVLWRSSPITDGADGALAHSAVLTLIEDPAPRSTTADAKSPHEPPGVSSREVEVEPRESACEQDRALRIVESVALLLWSARAGGEITFLNQCLHEYAGALARGPRALVWLDLVHPDDRERSEREWQACRASGTSFQCECRLRRHDGTFHWFDVRAASTGDSAPRVEWSFSGADVDDAHALREQQRADQERLRSIMESSPGVVLSYYTLESGNPQVLFVSSAAREVYGYSPEEIYADTQILVHRINQEDAAQAVRASEDALRTRRPWHGEYRYQHPSAGERWLEPHFVARRAPDGREVWNGIVLDITKRKQDEEQLKVVRTQLEAAIEAAQMGVWIIDLERQLIWGNERQRELWDIADDVPSWYTAELARGSIHPEDLARVNDEMARAVASNEPVEMEFRLLRADGSTRWISMRSKAECYPDGRPRRLMGINIDITQRKLLAEVIQRSQKLEALGTLAGGIAHDFNNVLFAISGNAALALGEVAEQSDAHQFLQEIASASARAQELVAQILAFSRPRDQKLEALALAEPVGEALRLARASLPSMIAIRTAFDPNTPMVLADASRIVQVVLNLCTNAAHAIGKGRVGVIDVRLSPVTIGDPERELGRADAAKGAYARLSVSDDGCGMDERTLARLFDPFYTTKAPGEGTGLGLSMAHGVVTSLGGAIIVSSQAGKGSTFLLYFPATEQASPAPRPSASRKLGRGQEILLVDDEAMIVELGQAMLKALGYWPMSFTRARDALAAFRSDPRRYAAVVTDLSMPDMSGFELARELLAIRADVPVLVMSGNLGPEERAAAARIGVREIVLKPVSMERMSELLAGLCHEV